MYYYQYTHKFLQIIISICMYVPSKELVCPFSQNSFAKIWHFSISWAAPRSLFQRSTAVFNPSQEVLDLSLFF